MTDLEMRFHEAMIDIYRRAKDECGYNATRFLSMLSERSGFAAARALLATSEPSSGFTALWEHGRLDLTVEAHVLKPEFAALFTQDEKQLARSRLEQYGYEFATVAESPTDSAHAGQARETREESVSLDISSSPTLQELRTARELFEANEPRDLFYRAATELVELALRKKTSLNLAEALAVLLQTWNRTFYQYRPFNSEHFAQIEDVLDRHLPTLLLFRPRRIAAFCQHDESAITRIFDAFEGVLWPVGAAKSLHLLCPLFFPIWDNAIAKGYGLALGRRGTNARRYIRFMRIAKAQCARLGGQEAIGRNPLKALDEYNYCKYTKDWI